MDKTMQAVIIGGELNKDAPLETVKKLKELCEKELEKLEKDKIEVKPDNKKEFEKSMETLEDYVSSGLVKFLAKHHYATFKLQTDFNVEDHGDVVVYISTDTCIELDDLQKLKEDMNCDKLDIMQDDEQQELTIAVRWKPSE